MSLLSQPPDPEQVELIGMLIAFILSGSLTGAIAVLTLLLRT